jgi:hypothetical protein
MTSTTGDAESDDCALSGDLPDNLEECHQLIKDLCAAVSDVKTQLQQLEKQTRKSGKTKR